MIKCAVSKFPFRLLLVKGVILQLIIEHVHI